MRRTTQEPREDWQRLVEEQGLLHHTHDDGKPYWLDSVCYEFTEDQVTAIERATEQLMRMCYKAVYNVITGKRYAELGIPKELVPLIEASWEQSSPALYDRFDLALNRQGQIKLIELNGATPTSLLEAAIIQHTWLLEQRPGHDQFNGIHEALLAKWKDLRDGGHLPSNVIYILTAPTPEDGMTGTYIAETAQRAGFEVRDIHPDDIDWDKKGRVFYDLSRDGHPEISTIFSLIPLEWLVGMKFADGTNTIEVMTEAFLAGKFIWMDPPWNVVFANKGILAILWGLYRDHPLLTPAYLDGPRDMTSYVVKPCQSREGANIVMVMGGVEVERSGGDWETEGPGMVVYQELVDVEDQDGSFPIIGSWYVPDEGACGIGVRESFKQRITGSSSCYAPHAIWK